MMTMINQMMLLVLFVIKKKMKHGFSVICVKAGLILFVLEQQLIAVTKNFFAKAVYYNFFEMF